MVTPAEVIAALVTAHQSVATCESLTGGLIAATLTSVPGASEVVRGGLITYAADLKTRLAGVPAAVIERYGVVSREVALGMAEGVRRVARADWGIGVTGVAGPGPADGVAPGTVWVAVVGPGVSGVRCLYVEGGRDDVRDGTVAAAIADLADALAHVQGQGGTPG